MSINGTIGNLALYCNEEVVLGKSVCYLVLKEKINKLFILNLLQTTEIKNYFINELTGSTIKNLSLKTIKNTKIKLPCLAEQEKIAGVLTAIDDKIDLSAQKIAKTKSYKKAMMQQMFV